MPEEPCFSVLIPTKNRSQLVGYAIRSVLEQDFGDFEIVVCDNDDDENATREAVGPFLSDRRVKYIRTGSLDMVANWNSALAASKGQYVTVLEDKMILYPGALAAIRGKIDQSPSGVVVWNTDRIQDRRDTPRLVRFVSVPDKVIKSDDMFSLLVTDIMAYWRFLPRGLSCVVPRQVIRQIMGKDDREFYEPMSPDFVSAMKVMDCVDSYLMVGDSYTLITTNLASNGKRLLYRENGGEVFKYYGGSSLKELKLEYVDIDNSLIVVNSVINDYRSMVARGYERLSVYPITSDRYVKMMAREFVSSTVSARRLVWRSEELHKLLSIDGGYVKNSGYVLLAIMQVVMEVLKYKLLGDKVRLVEDMPSMALGERIEYSIRKHGV